MSDGSTYLNIGSDSNADLHIPVKCSKCGGGYKYNGLGEYICTECGSVDYDDYGKVRNYLDEHKGCNAIEVEAATGVKRAAIHRLLEEERIEVKPYGRSELGKPN